MKDLKFLIIEDDKSNLDHLSRTLLYNVKASGDNVLEAESAEEAIDAISDFEPDIVLLDLKVPRKKGDEPNIASAVEILKEIELHNYRKNRFIRVIVISGSVQDAGVQQLILGDRSNIVKFLDKNAIAIDSDEFKDKLQKLIVRSINDEAPERTIDYSDLRRSIVKKLETIHQPLWSKINSEILDEFETLNEKNRKVHSRAKQIIGACGEVVEDIIVHLSNDSLDLSTQRYSNDFNSVRYQLLSLTGRKWNKDERYYELMRSDILISRSAAEFAIQAYKYRSEALHGKEEDYDNDNLFPNDYEFTLEDAAVSINLIMPLINDYIKHIEAKRSKK